MELYKKVVEYVDKSFKGMQKPHFERTVFWYGQFFEDLTEAHKIAAYAHDIERAFRTEIERKNANYLDSNFLKNHQEKGAEIISDFLKKENAQESLIQKVSDLISCHEVGGNEEQNALMNADSVSFFETNVALFLDKKVLETQRYNKVKEKLDWMYNRISNIKVKEIARLNYEKALKELEKFNKLKMVIVPDENKYSGLLKKFSTPNNNIIHFINRSKKILFKK